MTHYPSRQPMPGRRRRHRGGRVVAVVALCLALLLLGMFAGSWWTRTRLVPPAPAPGLPGPTSEPSGSTSPSGITVESSQTPHWPVDSAQPTTPAPTPVPHPEGINPGAWRATTLVTANRPDGTISAGTGIVVDPNGWVVTNYHVVQDSTDVVVTIWDGTRYPATVAGRDIWRDIAVLVTTRFDDARPVPFDPDGVVADEMVWSLGNAHGEGALVSSTGHVLDVGWSFSKPSTFGVGDHLLTGVVRFDGVVVPGYSGGPTFDADTEIVGMTTGYAYPWDPDQYTVIIPPDQILEVLTSVESGVPDGRIQVGPRAWLGLVFLTDDRVVAAVREDTPAARALIAPGSVIDTVDGVWMDSSQEILGEIELRNPGDVIMLGWTSPDGVFHEDQLVLTASPTN